MKYPEIKISIATPCHEDWNQMTPTDKGKFCGVCTKEVVDFTSKSDEEIVKHFKNHGNVCGRFHETQLERKLIVDRKKRNHWSSYAASLLFPLAIFSQEVKSEMQKVPKIEQTNTSTFTSLNIGSLQRQGKINTNIQNDTITVSGIVTDDTGLPLPGATVYIKETNKSVTTDFDGVYKIKSRIGNHLIFSYIGFEAKTAKVKSITTNIQLSVDGCLIMVGAVVTTEPNYEYVSTYKKTTYPKPMTDTEIKEKEERTKNYFVFQKKKWREKLKKRRAEKEAKRASTKN